ncbi:MAG: type III glutamate--ammonia ligase [Alphaproteobacteria bacterium]|nr:type III glutamate--ammonia ligase [Alphaproteobacteria bacterium]
MGVASVRRARRDEGGTAVAAKKSDLAAIAKDRGIRYFLIAYVDLFGATRAKLVPAAAIGGMQSAGAGFAGFATHLDMSPADADMFAVPDPASLMVLPWKPEVGWLAADLWMDGRPIDGTPRVLLKRLLADGLARGYRMRTGVECEFFLLSSDGKTIGDAQDGADKPCYDQQALMRRYDVIRAICDGMQDLGWGPYQNDHEDANGQFEMNWQYDDALTTADRHVFFKFMARSIAEAHGLRATFMPKPFAHLTGSGCHAHVSLWDPAGKRNLFHDPKGELGLSGDAYHFLGGVLQHASDLCVLFAPTVNSYKRLNAPNTRSGATWSPNTVTYGGNNRTHMVRIPDADRFELRLMDAAVNPYLGQAAILAAGLDGIAERRDPGKRLDVNMYRDGHKVKGVRRLPLYLIDAIRLLEKSAFARAAFGAEFVASYARLKTAEWDDYARSLTEWERRNTLDA